MIRVRRAAVWLGLAVSLSACNQHLGYWEPQQRDASVEPPADSSTAPSPHDGHDPPQPPNGPGDPPLPPSAASPPASDGTRCQIAAAPSCRLPSGATLPDEASADVPGVADWFGDALPLPAGMYRLEYVGGCMTYEIEGIESVFGWSVHTSTADTVLGTSACWLVTDGDALVRLAPGSEGTVPGVGAFATYGECVANNCGSPAIDFAFAGGHLGIRYGYAISLTYVTGAAQGGMAPTFRLTRLDACE